jgi:hypothetical protein
MGLAYNIQLSVTGLKLFAGYAPAVTLSLPFLDLSGEKKRGKTQVLEMV